MEIQVISQTELRLARFDSEELNVSLENDSDRYSAIAMFVTSIARCTFAVLDHYAMRMEVTTENIVMRLSWDFIQKPTRINSKSKCLFFGLSFLRTVSLQLREPRTNARCRPP